MDKREVYETLTALYSDKVNSHIMSAGSLYPTGVSDFTYDEIDAVVEHNGIAPGRLIGATDYRKLVSSEVYGKIMKLYETSREKTTGIVRISTAPYMRAYD